jgi:DNA ligase-1
MGTMAPKPMLARTLDESNVVFPCFAQPKLNGIRCLWDGQTAWTRSGLPHQPHIQRLLSGIRCPHGPLDGELMLAEGRPLEEVQSAVAADTEFSQDLRFRAFDVLCAAPFRDRRDLLGATAVEALWIRTSTQLESALERFLEAGHEGLIARDPQGLYESGYSEHLLKYKRFQDAEFPILDVLEAQGKDHGTAILVCQTPADQTFRVRPAGSRSFRSQILANRLSWLGRLYTVRFQGYTSHGIPRCAAGVAERTDIQWVMTFQV